MIALILPEKVPWESSIRATLGPHRVFRAPSVGRALGRLSARRRIQARLSVRRAVGRLAAQWLPTDTTLVMAPSLCGAEVFAKARRRGVETLLLEDLPDLAELHADLDAAAAQHPHEGFLNNTRASLRRVRRQQAERRLADSLRVQGEHAARRAGGTPLIAPEAPGSIRRTQTGFFGLAGPAMARTGALEALSLLDEFPDHKLRIRALPVTPPAVLQHPRVVTQPGPVDVWLAPSWVESWPAEVRAAARAGVPIVGTQRALGWETGSVHAPGDVHGLCAAVGERVG
ncbi:MAG: hypothetical protein AB8H79_20350 [Myxococcota bacterium]